MKGGQAVRQDILGIINNPDEQSVLRVMAINSLSKIGLSEDIELLTSIAENDTLARPNQSCIRGSKDSKVYPVRNAAKGAISSIKKRLSKKVN